MTKGRKKSPPKRRGRSSREEPRHAGKSRGIRRRSTRRTRSRDVAERVAIAHVIEKLEVDGPALRSPHQSGVMGEEGSGLRELRPRRGRSRWRPIYRRMAEELFAVLAVGPEAEIDKAGYAKAVRVAKQRLKRLERAKEKE